MPGRESTSDTYSAAASVAVETLAGLDGLAGRGLRRLAGLLGRGRLDGGGVVVVIGAGLALLPRVQHAGAVDAKQRDGAVELVAVVGEELDADVLGPDLGVLDQKGWMSEELRASKVPRSFHFSVLTGSGR